MRAALLLVLALPAFSADGGLLEALAAQMKNTPLLRVDFVQTRSLAALSKPLRASGGMVLSRDSGLLWQLRKPLALTYVVGPKGVLEVGPDGKRRTRSAQEVPAVAQMAKVFQSLLQGRWNVLEEHFVITATGRPERWDIVLAPRAQAAAFLKSIRVSGGRFIDAVRLEEASGDRMDLAFENPRLGPPLTEAESRLLAFE